MLIPVCMGPEKEGGQEPASTTLLHFILEVACDHRQKFWKITKSPIMDQFDGWQPER